MPLSAPSPETPAGVAVRRRRPGGAPGAPPAAGTFMRRPPGRTGE